MQREQNPSTGVKPEKKNKKGDTQEEYYDRSKYAYEEEEQKKPAAGDDMPYDLNEINGLSNHFNSGFDLLKKAIEFLANQQIDMKKRLGTVEKDVGGVLKNLNGLQDEIEDLGKSLETPSIEPSQSKENLGVAKVVNEDRPPPPKLDRRSPP